MSQLVLEREFPVDPETVFSYVTKPENLIVWWGHEDMEIIEHQLDFTRLGPWSSTLVKEDGGRHKMSGLVIAVDSPHAVEFTWAWHDDNDARGVESRVRFEVKPNTEGGTRFILTHSELADEQSATNHGQGWTSVLRQLERFVSHH